MGLVPGLLPGYHADPAAGLATHEMLASPDLDVLWVVGANPLKNATLASQNAFVVVQEMFLTDTAKVADIVFPAASAYEKDGTVTNTSGEIQLLRKGAEVMGTRTDFDLLRILSHQLERVGLGKAFHYKTPAAVFEEIRKAVPGYDVDITPLLTGSAEPTHVHVARNDHAPYDVPAGLIRSAQDTLFTTGTLTRFCTMMESLQEAEAKS